jgi:hypothetical protein
VVRICGQYPLYDATRNPQYYARNIIVALGVRGKEPKRRMETRFKELQRIVVLDQILDHLWHIAKSAISVDCGK